MHNEKTILTNNTIELKNADKKGRYLNTLLFSSALFNLPYDE